MSNPFFSAVPASMGSTVMQRVDIYSCEPFNNKNVGATQIQKHGDVGMGRKPDRREFLKSGIVTTAAALTAGSGILDPVISLADSAPDLVVSYGNEPGGNHPHGDRRSRRNRPVREAGEQSPDQTQHELREWT